VAQPTLWAAIDAGKAAHHCAAMNADGQHVLSRRVVNDEGALLGRPCCGATPAGTTPRAPLNVAPCRRYSDNSPVGTVRHRRLAAVYATRLGSFVAALLLAAVYPCDTPEDR
jgi:hypothetical protein